MAKAVNEKNTKKEILDALTEAKRALKEKDDGKISMKEFPKEVFADKVRNVTKQGILDNLSKSKLDISDYFSSLENLLIDKTTELSDLQGACVELSEKLSELQDIDSSLTELATILEAIRQLEINHRLKRSELETDLSREKKLKTEEHDFLMTQLENTRKHRLNEMLTELSQLKAKELARWEEDKQELISELNTSIRNKEKECRQREEGIKEKESEFDYYKKLAETFDVRLKEETGKVVGMARNELKRDHEMEVKLLTKDYQSNLALLTRELEISTKANETMTAETFRLRKDLDTAQQRVQEIAGTAVQSARPQVLTYGQESTTNGMK